jgi:hypothetical protein
MTITWIKNKFTKKFIRLNIQNRNIYKKKALDHHWITNNYKILNINSKINYEIVFKNLFKKKTHYRILMIKIIHTYINADRIFSKKICLSNNNLMQEILIIE